MTPIAAAVEREEGRAMTPEQIDEWRPIESAPRGENNPVIVWNGVTVVPAFAWEGGWADCWYDWMDPQPVAWKPLPKPPLAGGQIEEAGDVGRG